MRGFFLFLLVCVGVYCLATGGCNTSVGCSVNGSHLLGK